MEKEKGSLHGGKDIYLSYLGLGSLTQGKDRGSGIDSCLFP